MDEIKAIETRYKGYRFRSRLEARWAVFFDALDIKWEYEPERFGNEHGSYLPDFHLPFTKTWVEVKGDPMALYEDYERWTRLLDFGGVLPNAERNAMAGDFYNIIASHGFSHNAKNELEGG